MSEGGAAAPGGRGDLATIVLLAGALALAAASQTIAGAVAPDLEPQLGIDNTGIGLLVTATSLVGAATTLPFGVLADRTNRVRLLAGCALGWSAAVLLAGFAGSYLALLLAQLLLGAGIGAAGPLVASLAGDVFDPAERGRVYGYILAGEFAGAASGLLLAGEVAAAWSWRGSFWVMAVPGPVLAALLLLRLPEPLRRNDSTDAPTSPVGGADLPTSPVGGADLPTSPVGGGALAAAIDAAGVPPHAEQVLHEDPTTRPLGWAIRYVLHNVSNVVLIVASALVYFYVAGLQTFAIVFLRSRFGLGQGAATAVLVAIGCGVVIGILITGRLSDALIARGRISARPWVAGVSCLLAVALFAPGFAAGAVALAVPLFFLGSAAVGGANPPMDAARLDIMHSRLWGRAESVRTFLQTAFKSGAPLLFGFLSTRLAGSGGGAQGAGGLGLERTYLLSLAVVLLAAIVLLAVAASTYPRDVATAIASERATRRC